MKDCDWETGSNLDREGKGEAKQSDSVVDLLDIRQLYIQKLLCVFI